jgi:hypothetical protein
MFFKKTQNNLSLAFCSARALTHSVDISLEITTLPPPEDEPPACVIKLQTDGVEIDEIEVGEFFDIYVGDSTDDTTIVQVRFASDDEQDGVPTGEWTEWYDWDISSGDWNSEAKIMRWAFAKAGAKEVWAEVIDEVGQTAKSFANIYVVGPIADAGVDQSVFSGDLVILNGSKSDSLGRKIVSYQWDFGDGTTDEGKIVTHRFRGAQGETKTYTVTLTVEDDEGAIDTDTVQVTVAPLKRSVEISESPIFAKMTVTFNWIERSNGEDVYIVSEIHVEARGFIGVFCPTSARARDWWKS